MAVVLGNKEANGGMSSEVTGAWVGKAPPNSWGVSSPLSAHKGFVQWEAAVKVDGQSEQPAFIVTLETSTGRIEGREGDRACAKGGVR